MSIRVSPAYAATATEPTSGVDAAPLPQLTLAPLPIDQDRWRVVRQGDRCGQRAWHPPGEILPRVFVSFHGAKVILVLDGYDKAKDPSEKRQQEEIANARRLLTAWKLEQAKAKKQRR